DRHSLDVFDELGRVAVSLRKEEHPVLLPSYRGVVGATKAASRFNKRLENRLEIEGRATDNLEHIGRCSLLLQRFAQFLRARLHLVEQPHILNCDHSLVGESRHQLDLLLGERLYDRSRERENTDRDSLPKQRNG